MSVEEFGVDATTRETYRRVLSSEELEQIAYVEPAEQERASREAEDVAARARIGEARTIADVELADLKRVLHVEERATESRPARDDVPENVRLEDE